MTTAKLLDHFEMVEAQHEIGPLREDRRVTDAVLLRDEGRYQTL